MCSHDTYQCFEGSADQAVPFVWDQGPTFVTFGIKDQKCGYKMGSAIKEHTPL